jgi:hypothetical protein
MLSKVMTEAVRYTRKEVEELTPFSAYDITLRIRDANPDLYVRHDNTVRGIVHGYMACLIDKGEYKRKLVKDPESGANYYLYYPNINQDTLDFVKGWVRARYTFTPQSIAIEMSKEGVSQQSVTRAIEVTIQDAEYKTVEREHDAEIFYLYRPVGIIQDVSRGSSWLEGWQYTSGVLTIYKQDGKVFMYDDVDADCVVGLAQAESVGRYFNRHIKNNYAYTSVIP